jgi:hypothetical protein
VDSFTTAHEYPYPPKNYNDSLALTKALGIKADTWTANFTSSEKMLRGMKQFLTMRDANHFIYHSELDEMPDQREFSAALAELNSGQCDAIRYVTSYAMKRSMLNRLQV